MKTSKDFKETIKTYLDEFAKKDEYFAARYDESRIDGCCNYIIQTVKDSGCNGFNDDEIYQMSVHFYLEGLEDGEAVSCQVVVNHQIELTEEEKEEARAKALENFQKEEEKRLKKEQERQEKKEQKKAEKEKAKPKPAEVPSLFDMFEGEEDGS